MRTKLGHAIRWVAVLMLGACLAGMAGCGGSGSDSAGPQNHQTAPQALLGLFRTPGGDEFEFRSDGRCLTSRGAALFSVDGKAVRLVLQSGEVRQLQWVEPDVLRFDRPGKEALLLYREGSAASQRPEAQPKRQTAERVALPSPDPSVPLDQYVPLASAMDLRLLFAAHQADLSDDQKVALIDESAPADSFARRDFLAERWPTIEAKLAKFRTAYVRVDVSQGRRLGASPVTGPQPLLWMTKMTQGGLNLQPFDLDTGRFPISSLECLGATSVSGQDMQILQLQAPTGPSGLCALPVSDEGVARAVEARRTRSSAFPIEVKLYAFVQAIDAGPAKAVITHASVALYTDRAATEPLATVELTP